jgi:hypothetical protein
MTDANNSDQSRIQQSRDQQSRVQESNDQKRQARKPENNPFSEQEKHGPDAHRRSPGSAQEYHGDPSVQPRSPGVEDDTGEDEKRSA